MWSGIILSILLFKYFSLLSDTICSENSVEFMKKKARIYSKLRQNWPFPGNLQQKTSQGRDFKPCRIRNYDKAMLPAKNP